ncbi:Periplasmic ferric-dicitrate binding protein FecR, regulates iron transport [Zobellia roscoffensis]|uniref:FecR family protein n=1 Tax=Zobellia roscoffensis TaxID=2779508 RepID=UPI00188C11F3|nr:FecR family protein [Zobellia roscoffensis]
MKNNITKLLMGTISEEELVALRKWLDNPENQSILETYVKEYHDLNLSLLKDNVEEAYVKALRQIERTERPVRKLLPNWAKYAAAAVLIFGLGLMYQQGVFSTKKSHILVPNDDVVTLVTENGSVQTIDVQTSEIVKDENGNVIGKQEKNQINYSVGNEVKELIYNTLNVPKGKTFQITLSDGTVVHMNAGSSLRYPVNFSPTQLRKVFLDGEAYFDVTKDKSRPFIVNVDDLDVKVLGTEFNVSSYSEDANIEVVLVEGAVGLNKISASREEGVKLVPGQRGAYRRNSENIHIDSVNTDLYTSWMQGHLVFRELTFDQILTKLGRHYNIELENRNSELGHEVFNASFNDATIEEVMSFFNDTHEIDYEISDNKVIIK